MNALEFINLYKDKTEEQLKGIIIQSYWDIDNVDNVMSDNGIPLDAFTYDEKCQLLERVIGNSDGYSSDEDTHYAIEDAVIELYKKKTGKDLDDEDDEQ